MAAARFEILDGQRGIAAIAVLLYHLESPLHRVAEAGYLAVDLFFLMSGFVVAGAYEARLLDGWGVLGFMRQRLQRLWPLYILGLALGIACFEIVKVLRPDLPVIFPPAPMAEVVLSSLFFLPQIQSYAGPIFPFNVAAWSLSVEIFGNLVYAMFVRALRNTALMAIAGIGFAMIVFSVLRKGNLDIGFGRAADGYVRFMFSFPVGVLLYRLHSAGRLSLPRLPAWLPLVLTAMILAGVFGHGGVSDLVAVGIAFPAILLMSLSQPQSQLLARLCAGAGAASYALYMLHPPLIALAAALWGPHPDAFASLVLDLGIVVLAVFAERWFDRPLQRRLRAVAPITPALAK
jgi:peptidoglycan/LPS O-acetylase OafA/YrhL